MNKTIGIVGGGQLGRMLTEAAIKLGLKVIVVDPSPHCPASQVGAEQIVAEYTDTEATLSLSKRSDFVTIEIEHINTQVLADIERQGTPVNPAPQTIELIKDKYTQKAFLKDAGLPVGEFSSLESAEQAQALIDIYQAQVMLKSRFNAFDGRGNTITTSSDQIMAGVGRHYYAERIVPFKKELAVVFARDFNGNIQIFPVVETVHKRSICTEVIAPAPIAEETAKKAIEIARQTAQHLSGAGVFAIEMLLTRDDQILINEIAPRVHNSGHYTMDACKKSQFEQHIRAVTGMELGDTSMTVPAAVMVNILGERDGPVELSGVEEAEKIDGVSVYTYGKSPTKVDRKMGHINAVGATIEEARDKAWKARKLITI